MLDPSLNQVTPSTSENGYDITLREAIDKVKLEYIVAHPEQFEIKSRNIGGVEIDKDRRLTPMKY